MGAISHACKFRLLSVLERAGQGGEMTRSHGCAPVDPVRTDLLCMRMLRGNRNEGCATRAGGAAVGGPVSSRTIPPGWPCWCDRSPADEVATVDQDTILGGGRATRRRRRPRSL